MRVALTFLFLAGLAVPSVAAKPNVLFILADDLGYGDLSCYGGRDFPTPNIDRLARDGVRMTAWYAQPFCTPSRYALLTGQHPNRTPPLVNALNRADPADHGKGLPAGIATLPGLLRAAGYRSTLLGKWHLGHGDPRFLPTRHGFDRFFGHTGGCVDMFTLRYGDIPDWYEGERLTDVSGYATDVVTDEAVRFIGRRRAGDAPFHLHLGFAAPHYGKPWDPVRKVPFNLMQAKAESIARLGSIEPRDRRVFAAMVVELDEAIGRILAALDAAGLARDTLVVFVSDNGGDVDFGGHNGALRGEKGTLWEGGIRVPCVLRWPGKIKPGAVLDQPAMMQDWLPTLCRLAGVPTRGLTLDGIDLGPVLFEGGTIARDVFHARGAEASLRQGRWKFLRTEGADRLFDLSADAGEQRDLSARHPEIVARLKARHAATAAGL